ncbi:MAG: hypothetical protein ACP5IB_08835 [Thermoplasmata archaeon]
MKELKVYTMNLLDNKRTQNEIYREVNASDKPPPYFINGNTIYFLSKEDDLNKNMHLFKQFNTDSPKIQSFSLTDNHLLIRRLIRETLIGELSSRGRPVLRKKNAILIKMNEDKNFRRFLYGVFSYESVEQSLLLIFDLIHDHPKGSYDIQSFKKYSMLKPAYRYNEIKEIIMELFSNLDEIILNVPANGLLYFHRIRENINSSLH